MVYHIIPYIVERIYKRFIACFRIHISSAGKKIIGTNGMASHLIHFPEWLSIAVIVSAINCSADINKVHGKVQVLFFLGGAIEFCKSHIMRWTNSIACLFWSGSLIKNN